MLSRTTSALLLFVCWYAYGRQQAARSTSATDDEGKHLVLDSKLPAINNPDLIGSWASRPNRQEYYWNDMEWPLQAAPGIRPANVEEWVHHIACQSDLIVLGSFSSRVSGLANNGNLVFSDYHFDVADTIYERKPFQLKKIVVVTFGGSITTQGRTFETIVPWVPDFPIGGLPYYLLFLKRPRSNGSPSDSFFLTDLPGAFYLFPDHPMNLLPSKDRELAPLMQGISRSRMIAAIKQGAPSCEGDKLNPYPLR